MGADSTHIFYGVRYQVPDESEIEQLQRGEHILVKAAKKAGLQTYWGKFDVNGGSYYLLYIGREIATVGYEGAIDIELSDTQLAQIQLETRRKLATGNFSFTPAFFAQFEPDV